MTLQNTLGEGVICVSEDGSRHYKGKVLGNIRRDESVSLVRTCDLEFLEMTARNSAQITEPISKNEALFPAKIFFGDDDESEHVFFDGYKYYMQNNIWVRYNSAEEANGVIRRKSQYSVGDGIIMLSGDRFHDFNGFIYGDVKKGERVSLIKTRHLDALERTAPITAPQLIGPVNRYESFPDKWPLDKGGEQEHGYLFGGFKYATKDDSVWISYHPVEN